MIYNLFSNLISNTPALIIVILTIIAFFYFLLQAGKLLVVERNINKALSQDDVLLALHDTKLSNLAQSYKKSITIDVNGISKTNMPSAEFFSEASVCKQYKINLRTLDIAAGSLVGLGLFGTFLGLTLGISNFDSATVDNIQSSIQSLLGGMSTAFVTSLAGMIASLIYSHLEKLWKNNMSRALYDLTEKLDSQYYIDDIALLQYREEAMLEKLSKNIVSAVVDHLTYTDANGQKTMVANTIREILRENTEQSKALKSFSTDLALEMSDRFDHVLDNQLKDKILPLMENVDATTKAIVEHIDQMASVVASPASDIIQVVVDELKQSMNAMMAEFKNNLSDNASTQIESLAESLSSAAQSMVEFPKNMENISATLQLTIAEVKDAVSEISNTSANSNNLAMQQMQQQITFATTSIDEAINEVKNVMSAITQTSEQSNNTMIGKLSTASEQMTEFLQQSMSTMTSSVQSSMKSITDDMADKQADLLAFQESTIEETRKLLLLFNTGLERLEKINTAVGGTMNEIQQVQCHIVGSTAHLQTITGDMKHATELFSKSQTDYTGNMLTIQQMSQRNIDAVSALLKESGEVSQDYVENFETIRTGLSQIFSQIQTGLGEYSRVVRTSMEAYLSKYADSLTRTTDALSNTIQQQSDVVEMLVESMNKRK